MGATPRRSWRWLCRPTTRSIWRYAAVATWALICAPGAEAQQTRVQALGNALAVGVSAATLGSTFIEDDARGRGQLTRSAATNLGVVFAFKLAFPRVRPDGSNDDSFPSGHAAVAFNASTFLHRRYGLGYAAPAYAASLLVAYSRVEAGRHHLADAVAGALLGMAIALAFTERDDRPGEGQVAFTLALALGIGGGG